MSPIRKEVTIGDCPASASGSSGMSVLPSYMPLRPFDGGSRFILGALVSPFGRKCAAISQTRVREALPVHRWISEGQWFQRNRAGEVRRYSCDWAERERYWVSQYDDLLNVTDGGLGAQQRRRMSSEVAEAIRLGTPFCQQCGDHLAAPRYHQGTQQFCLRACYQARSAESQDLFPSTSESEA